MRTGSNNRDKNGSSSGSASTGRRGRGSTSLDDVTTESEDEVPCEKCRILKGRIPKITFRGDVSQRERAICGDIWHLYCKECKAHHRINLVLSESADEADSPTEPLIDADEPPSPTVQEPPPSPGSSRPSPIHLAGSTVQPAASTNSPPKLTTDDIEIIEETLVHPPRKKRGRFAFQ